MVIGSPTFTGDLAEVYGASPDFVLLRAEPYAFSPDDGPEVLPDTSTILVGGRLLTRYGSSLVTGHEELTASLDRLND